MSEIFYWASDQSTKSGEGKLAKMFVRRLKSFNKKKKFIKSKVILLKKILIQTIFFLLLKYTNTLFLYTEFLIYGFII